MSVQGSRNQVSVRVIGEESGSADRTFVRRTALIVPEYWPRPHLLAVALEAAEVLICDSFQYSRQSFQNRARVRTPQGWHWISVPLQARQHGRPIAAVEIAPHTEWAAHHLRSLQHNYGTTPFFPHFAPEITDLLGQPWNWLGDLTSATTEWLLRAFGIKRNVIRTSSMDPMPNGIESLGAHLQTREVFVSRESARRDLQTLPDARVVGYDESPRHQNFAGFECGMSALDLLCNYGREGLELIARDMHVESGPLQAAGATKGRSSSTGLR